MPNGFSLPYYLGPQFNGLMNHVDPYASTTQSTDLRKIESQFTPTYGVKSNVLELSVDLRCLACADFRVRNRLQQRFPAAPRRITTASTPRPAFSGRALPATECFGSTNYLIDPNGVFCDPQLGCSDRLVAEDMVVAKCLAVQPGIPSDVEFRRTVQFQRRRQLLHYETEENYYVFINSLTAFSWAQGGGNVGSFVRPG